MNKLKVYYATLTESGTGIWCISLVDSPAVESNWVALSKEDMQFKIEDEEQRIVTGVVMRADFNIFRQDDVRGKYFIRYDKQTIKDMAERFIWDGRANQVDENHNFELTDGVYLRELFIKDNSRGIVPKGFEKIEDGSLFATYHITNDEIWEKVKDGTFRGFSLAGSFALEEVEDDITDAEYEDIMDTIKRLYKKMK